MRVKEKASAQSEKKSRHSKTEAVDSNLTEEKRMKSKTKSETKAQKQQPSLNLGKRSLQLSEETAVQNESPRLSKVEKKQQRKREEKLGSNLSHFELLQRRSTRALSKNNEIEVLSEPIIYSVKKQRKHEGRPKRDSSLDESINEDSNNSMQAEISKANEEQKDSGRENQIMKPVSENIPNMLAQLETLSKLIKRNAQRKENKSILDEADQEKLSKILGDFQNQIVTQQNQNSFKMLNQVVTLLLKNQNFLQLKETVKDQLASIKNYFSENSQSWNSTQDIEINCGQENSDHKNASSSQESLIFFRKSVCQKLAKILEEAYCMEKDPAQELTLLIEGRVNNYFPEALCDYKKAIKSLYKLMKVKLLTVEELKSIIGFKCDEFKSWLKLKVQKFVNNHKQIDDIEIEIEQSSAVN